MSNVVKSRATQTHARKCRTKAMFTWYAHHSADARRESNTRGFSYHRSSTLVRDCRRYADTHTHSAGAYWITQVRSECLRRSTWLWCTWSGRRSVRRREYAGCSAHEQPFWARRWNIYLFRMFFRLYCISSVESADGSSWIFELWCAQRVKHRSASTPFVRRVANCAKINLYGTHIVIVPVDLNLFDFVAANSMCK